jgi:chromosome segregation ATPase
MTLRAHATITADAKQARQELDQTTKAVDALGQEVAETGGKTDKVAAQFAKMRAEIEAQKRAMASLQSSHTAQGAELQKLQKQYDAFLSKTKQMPPAFNGAAGSVGNLTSQFNDIGVMLAAGQNPLQLAIQQGTQIGQVSSRAEPRARTR